MRIRSIFAFPSRPPSPIRFRREFPSPNSSIEEQLAALNPEEYEAFDKIHYLNISNILNLSFIALQNNWACYRINNRFVISYQHLYSIHAKEFDFIFTELRITLISLFEIIKIRNILEPLQKNTSYVYTKLRLNLNKNCVHHISKSNQKSLYKTCFTFSQLF